MPRWLPLCCIGNTINCSRKLKPTCLNSRILNYLKWLGNIFRLQLIDGQKNHIFHGVSWSRSYLLIHKGSQNIFRPPRGAPIVTILSRWQYDHLFFWESCFTKAIVFALFRYSRNAYNVVSKLVCSTLNEAWLLLYTEESLAFVPFMLYFS